MSIFHTRPMANKENSLHPTSCLPSFISKPTLSGLGRSPKKKSSSIHGAKPYSRTASVHAKPIKNKTKTGKKVPPPLDLTKIRQMPVAIRSEVKIPLSLPKVNIPLVPHLDEFFDGDIPFDYIRQKLLPRLSGFGIVSAQFRPYPTLSLPPHSSTRPSMAFGIPQIMEGQNPHHHLASKLAGRLPDLCLAISKKGDVALKVPASLVPVNQLVFALHCFHWPRLIALLATPAQTPVVPIFEVSPSPELGSIQEDQEEESEEQSASTQSTEVDSDSASDSAESSSTVIPTPPTSPTLSSDDHLNSERTTPPVLHLPIQSLPLPSPETYSYIHNLLHFTHSPAPSTFSPLQNILGMDVSELHKLDTRDLMKKLAVIQGVWKNCCYLGIGDVKIWMGMRDAWGAVVGLVAERNKRVVDVNMDTQ